MTSARSFAGLCLDFWSASGDLREFVVDLVADLLNNLWIHSLTSLVRNAVRVLCKVDEDHESCAEKKDPNAGCAMSLAGVLQG